MTKIMRVRAGETIPPGTDLAVDEDGRVRVAGLGDHVVGRTPTRREMESLPTLPDLDVDETLFVPNDPAMVVKVEPVEGAG